MTKDEFMNLLFTITATGQDLQLARMRGEDIRPVMVQCREARAAALTEFERVSSELESMTVDRDSETRWAYQYKNERDMARVEVEQLRKAIALAWIQRHDGEVDVMPMCERFGLMNEYFNAIDWSLLADDAARAALEAK